MNSRVARPRIIASERAAYFYGIVYRGEKRVMERKKTNARITSSLSTNGGRRLCKIVKRATRHVCSRAQTRHVGRTSDLRLLPA